MAWTTTRAELRAYWQSLPPGTIVGRTQSLRQCPLALYLARQHRSLKAALERGDVPAWVYRFMRQLDLARGPVTAGRALAVLDLIDALEEARAHAETELAPPSVGHLARPGVGHLAPVLFDPGAAGPLDGPVG